MKPEMHEFEVGIIGGGPAGLTAAIVLGRCRRNVIVFDHSRPRNRQAKAIHGYLGHDGIAPERLRELGRGEARRYGVVLVEEEVVAVDRLPEESSRPAAFEVRSAPGRLVRVRKLLLATGIADELPPVQNIRDFYGTSVHHCPYCDGWEHRDQRLVAVGDGHAAVGLALALKQWSVSVTACSNGTALTEADLGRLQRNGIAHRGEPVVRLAGSGGVLRDVEFTTGPPLDCDALFFQSAQDQQSPLAAMIGCRIDEQEHVKTERKQSSGVPGLYIAGDAAGDVQFASVAAAEGAIAATAINRELQEEDQPPPSGGQGSQTSITV